MTKTIYSILSANDWSNLIRSNSDPGLRNETASEAIDGGTIAPLHERRPISTRPSHLFKTALEAEPNSSLAHAYLSMEATGRNHFSPDRSFLDLGKQAAEKALQLSPASAEAHRALSGVYYQEGKFAEALEQALQTMEIGGLQDRLAIFIGMTLDMLGRPHQALPLE